MSKKIATEFDTRGALSVDCSECERGGNGDKSCSSGWKTTKQFKGSCFSGTPLPAIKEALGIK